MLNLCAPLGIHIKSIENHGRVQINEGKVKVETNLTIRSL